MRFQIGCHIFWSLFGGSIALILFSVFIVLKIDNAVDWSWYSVFIPVWVSFLFYTWFIIWVFVFAIDQSKEGLLGAAFWIETAGIGVIIWTVLITLKLELSEWSDVNWGYIFIPAWAAMALFSLIHPGWPEWDHEFHWDQKLSDYDLWRRYFEVLPLNTLGAIAVFTILLVLDLQLSHQVCYSWSLCFTPFWYLCGVWLCLICTNIQQIGGSHVWPNVFGPSLIAIPFFAFVILMALFLEGIIPLLTYAFIPLFLLELVWFCSSCIIPFVH